MVRNIYRALARPSIRRLKELLDPEVDWSVPPTIPFGGRFCGPRGVAGFIAQRRRFFPQLRIHAMRLLEASNTVIATGRYRGQTDAETRFDLSWVHLWTFETGRVVAFSEYLDTSEVMGLLGQHGDAGAVATRAYPRDHQRCTQANATCSKPDDVPGKPKGTVTCASGANTPCVRNGGVGCDCHLFRGDTSEGHEEDDWEFVEGGQEKMKDGYVYICACTQ
jgi:ketosteroid isomerase-like protein